MKKEREKLISTYDSLNRETTRIAGLARDMGDVPIRYYLIPIINRLDRCLGSMDSLIEGMEAKEFRKKKK